MFERITNLIVDYSLITTHPGHSWFVRPCLKELTQHNSSFSFHITVNVIIQKFDLMTQRLFFFNPTKLLAVCSLQGLFSSKKYVVFNQSIPNTQITKIFEDNCSYKSKCTHSVKSSPQSSVALGLEERVRKRVLFSSTGMFRLSTQHSSPTWACEPECTPSLLELDR